MSALPERPISMVIGALGGERTRWDAMMADLNSQVDSMAGSSLLAGAFLVYLADETEQVRANMLAEWSDAFQQGGLLKPGWFDVNEGKLKLLSRLTATSVEAAEKLGLRCLHARSSGGGRA